MSSSRAFQKSGFHLRITLQFLEIVHVGSPLSRVIALRGFVGASLSASHARHNKRVEARPNFSARLANQRHADFDPR